MTETDPDRIAPTDLYLSNDPAMIAAFIKHRKSSANTPESETQTETKPPPYNFADFVTDMNMTDFEDAYQVRALLESQGHLLGTAFQYLMMDGDWKNLQHILRTQKVMRDTMELMNNYPPLSFMPTHPRQTKDTDAAPLD